VLSVLCRNDAQIDVALESGIALIYADFEDVARYKDLVKRFRQSAKGSRLFLATPRIQKAGEAGLFRVVERAEPDGVLVRNLGGAGYFQERKNPPDSGIFRSMFRIRSQHRSSWIKASST